MEKVRTRTAEMWKDENGIFWVTILPGVKIDKEDIADNMLVTRNIIGNTPSLRIFDSRNNWEMTAEAEMYYKNEDTPEKTIARAVLVSSVADKMIKSFLTKLYKPSVPLNFFTNGNEAVKWLMGFKK
ncbi:MAG TPA: hypothetical protein VNY73_00895 [Bacteroidia bacterium]|nr:hypothetical protein [Bacteroidia bacterium]